MLCEYLRENDNLQAEAFLTCVPPRRLALVEVENGEYEEALAICSTQTVKDAIEKKKEEAKTQEKVEKLSAFIEQTEGKRPDDARVTEIMELAKRIIALPKGDKQTALINELSEMTAKCQSSA